MWSKSASTAPTSITLLFESVLPRGSDTVSVTVYSPGWTYLCDGLWPPDRDEPSPKLQCRRSDPRPDRSTSR